jgi:hypothetical protein
MTTRRVMTTFLPLFVAVPLIWVTAPSQAAPIQASRMAHAQVAVHAVAPAAAATPAAMAATVTPDTVWPNAAPCTTGTGVHTFTVSGLGFQPDELLTISVGDVRYERATADENGEYTASYELKAQPAGQYDVEVVGDRGSRATGGINLGWSGCRSWKNGKIRLTGAGFTADDTVSAYLDGATAAAASATTTDGGEFELHVACVTGRTHTVAVSDTRNRALSFAEFSCV